MVSTNEFYVNSRVLKNETNSRRSYHGNDFRLIGSRGIGAQAAMHQYDSDTGIMFFAEIGRDAISCVNTAMPLDNGLRNHAILAQDHSRMIYPSDLKVIKSILNP